MKTLIIILTIILTASLALAQQPIYIPRQPNYYTPPAKQYQPYQQRQPVQKYNPMEGKFQTTYPRSRLKYNPLGEKGEQWKYVAPDARPVYNPMEGKFEFPE